MAKNKSYDEELKKMIVELYESQKKHRFWLIKVDFN